jgi:hypothetical protein
MHCLRLPDLMLEAVQRLRLGSKEACPIPDSPAELRGVFGTALRLWQAAGPGVMDSDAWPKALEAEVRKDIAKKNYMCLGDPDQALAYLFPTHGFPPGSSFFDRTFGPGASFNLAYGRKVLADFHREFGMFQRIKEALANRKRMDDDYLLQGIQTAVLQHMRAGGDAAPGYQGRFTPLQEFMATEHHYAWLVEGVLVTGQPAVLGGPRKALKTSVAVDLALSLAAGKSFLGRFPVPSPRRVGVISVEQGEAGIQDLFRRVAKAKGVGAGLDNCFVDFALPKLGRASDLLMLAEAVKANHLEVFILDPLYLALWNDKGLVNTADLAAMGSLLLEAANVCLDAGCTPVFVHHAGKIAQLNRGRDCEPMDMDDLSGAGVAEAARQFLLLSRRKPYEDDGRHEMWVLPQTWCSCAVA